MKLESEQRIVNFTSQSPSLRLVAPNVPKCRHGAILAQSGEAAAISDDLQDARTRTGSQHLKAGVHHKKERKMKSLGGGNQNYF